MTTHYVTIQASPGETATAKLFDLNGVSDVVRGTSAATADKTNDKGTYVFAFTNVAAGNYTIKPFADDGSALTGSMSVTFTGVDAEVAIARDQGAARLDSAELRLAIGLAAADLDSQLATMLAATIAATGSTVLQNADEVF